MGVLTRAVLTRAMNIYSLLGILNKIHFFEIFKVLKHAAVTKGTPPHLLCIHLGQEEYAYNDESPFSRLSNEVEMQILTSSSEIAAKLSCSYKKWVDSCGLLGCKNLATADYLSQVVASVELDGQSFPV